MKPKDLIHITDAGQIRTSGGATRCWGDERSVIEVHGWVEIVARERGKLVPKACRPPKHNVFTNTGREYVAQRISLFGSGAYRSDVIAYMGVGTGAQLEEPGVLRLTTPIQYNTGLFMAAIDSSSFPLYPVRTTVEYRRVFGEGEISLLGQTQLVSEIGLFTNGDPDQDYAFDSMPVGFDDSNAMAPVSYKAFEPIGKSNAMELEVIWQLRL